MQVADQADAQRMAELVRQHEQEIVYLKEIKSSLQTELVGRADALIEAQARIMQPDQERSDAAAPAEAHRQQLVTAKARPAAQRSPTVCSWDSAMQRKFCW